MAMRADLPPTLGSQGFFEGDKLSPVPRDTDLRKIPSAASTSRWTHQRVPSGKAIHVLAFSCFVAWCVKGFGCLKCRRWPESNRFSKGRHWPVRTISIRPGRNVKIFLPIFPNIFSKQYETEPEA